MNVMLQINAVCYMLVTRYCIFCRHVATIYDPPSLSFHAATATTAGALSPFFNSSLRAYSISARSFAMSKVASGLAAINALSLILSNMLPSALVDANHSSTVSAMPSGLP